MKRNGGKALVFGSFIILSAALSGCGSQGTREPIKTGEERALEAREDASEVVDQINRNVEQFNQDVKEMDED